MSGVHLFLFQNRYIKPYISIAYRVVNILMVFAALFVVAAVVYRYGFNISPKESIAIGELYRVLVRFFMIIMPVRIVLGYLKGVRKIRLPIMILIGLLYLMILPMIFHIPIEPMLAVVWKVLGSVLYMQLVLTAFAMLELSDAVVGLLGRKTNPSLIFIVSFLAIIAIGTGLLLLPNATVGGISIIDALFVSTSAVCVTGLTPVDIAVIFTPLGKLFILMLIQVGGLGLMTITSFFALFFMGNTSLYNQLAVSDVVSSKSINSLLGTLLRILGFTLIFEGVGVLFVWMSVHGELHMTLQQELAFAAFHSISAFCNAGFSTLSGNLNNVLLQGNISLMVTISWLIILGGIGFPILSNFMHIVGYHIKNRLRTLFVKGVRMRRQQHLYNLNTKIVLVTTGALLLLGTLLIAFFEWHHAFEGMSVAHKWAQAFFSAVTPRTAGFNSLPMSSYAIQTVLITIFLMWIGGASQSTAGGIKVNAFAVAFINLFSVARAKHKSEVYARELSDDSVHRANATIFMSVIVIFSSLFLLSVLEPEIPLINLFYEIVSAISTVGLSLNTTPLLDSHAKLVVISLMFIGRIGLITLMLGVLKRPRLRKFNYPKDDIIIN